MKNLAVLLCVLFLFSCSTKQDISQGPEMTMEEFRNQVKEEREAAYKAFLQSPEGQRQLGEIVDRGKGDAIGGGGNATHCDCLYSIESLEVDLGSAEDYEYQLWSTEECNPGSPFGCGYFSAYYSTFYPQCYFSANPSCVDILNGTYPVYPQGFNCQVPINSTFDVNHAIIGVDPSSCSPIFLGASSITFTIKCCDQAATPGSDLNNCGEPSRCYSSPPITIDLAGGWNYDGGVNIDLEGCGCVPTL